MGRELKRVAMDFSWPINVPWKGFINELYTPMKCPHCDHGFTPMAKHFRDLFWGYIPFKPEDNGSVPYTFSDPDIHALAERNVSRSPEYFKREGMTVNMEAMRMAEIFNRSLHYHPNEVDVKLLFEAGDLNQLTHNFVPGKGWIEEKNPGHVPTVEDVRHWLVSADSWSISGSSMEWTMSKSYCAQRGVPHECPHCEGTGEVWISPEAKQAADDWTRTEPPEGEGYQIWETVSEGSPISPVFATPEELAEHMSTTRWGADEGTSVEQWLRFINGPGWAPSMVMDSNGLRTGVEAI